MKRAVCLFTVLASCSSVALSRAAEIPPPSPEVKAITTYAPAPSYPFEAAGKRPRGSGTVLLQVDKASGVVTKAEVTRSTGSPLLDNAALKAFRRWRFKPGAVDHVRMPFGFYDFDPGVPQLYWGTVKAIDRRSGTFTLNSRMGAKVVVFVTPRTRLSKNGAPATLAAVAVGDRVRG
ncbi:MAG TPA: energy transducer TonB, partial [Chthoniobacterales bacterium]